MLENEIQMLYNVYVERSELMAQISLRVDDELKQDAEKVFDEIGLTTSAAINIFLKTVVRENRIPFELSADPFYNKENIAELERRIANLNSGKSTLKEHDLIEID
jgi:DNA-damage-inducible protein J